MWKGRFAQATTDLVQQYGESISYDWRLYKHDIAGSIAHARAQLSAGLLSEQEFNDIKSGLLTVQEDIENDRFTFSAELEDIHMNVEAELTKRIGAAGGKLHTARSRNDQVATSTRLYCRDTLDTISTLVRNYIETLLKQAEAYADALIPGYTHLQRGQPVTVGHHLLAYVEMAIRDLDRIAHARSRTNVCPLGSGALAGSTINLDRQQIADDLGFANITHNSMDAISDRDYILDILYALAVTGMHLSRLSEDLILWCSSEFGFATLSDAHTTGSSLMPQKKNPDVCELTRGKTGRLYGNLVSLLTSAKGLPLTYNRDLQEDKEPLFDSIDTIILALKVNTEMLAAMTINTEACELAASDPMLLATDLADYLVKEGVPFRSAHELVGKAVAVAVSTNTPLDQINLTEISEHYKADAQAVFNLQKALSARTNIGAPNPDNVRREIKRLSALIVQ